MRAFKTYVRPILEYACCVWSPTYTAAIKLIESVQRKFTKRLPGYSHLDYASRLRRLKVESLELRRLHSDSIPGVPAVLKFLKFQSCPEIVLKFQRVLKFWCVCENVLNFALAVTLHNIKTFLVRSLLYEHSALQWT